MKQFPSRWLLAAACTFAPLPVAAQIYIHGESWSLPAGIQPLPGSSVVRVEYDATVEGTNDPQGSRLGAGIMAGPNRWDQSWSSLATFFAFVNLNLPLQTQSHVQAHFEVELRIACDGGPQQIVVTQGSCTMSYRHPSDGEIVRVDIPLAFTNALHTRATFGLRVPGGQNPTSETALYCDAGERSIGIWFDPEGTQCHGTIPPGAPGTVYVLAKLGTDAGGISGAEFRFAGVPGSWQTWATPNPAIVAIGNPLGDGIVAGMPCMRPTNGIVSLYSIQVIALQEENDVVFTIEKARPPANPQFQCPLIVQCDDPMFTMYCVETAPCFVNATGTTPCAVVGVESTTWSAVKTMYD